MYFVIFFIPLLEVLKCKYKIINAIVYLTFKLLICSFITLGIPTLLASIAFEPPEQRVNKLFNIIVPIICVILFWSHPTGRQVLLYPLYWIIPVMLNASKNKMMSAIRASFIAHAAGSVIWLYTLNTSCGYWNGLIFKVPLERFVIAGSIYFIFSFINQIKILISRRNTGNLLIYK